MKTAQVRAPSRPAGQQAPENTPSVAEWTLPARVSEAAVAAGVDITAALSRLGGNQGLYLRVLRMFVDELANMPAQLAACVARGEAQSAMRVLHTLKGQAGLMGAMALSAEAADGEKRLAGGLASDDAELLVQQTSAAIAAAGPGLAALLQALQVAAAPMAAPTRSLDTDAVLTLLRTIARHLQNADMAATDAMADLQRQFGGALGEQLQPMDEAIGALDFDRALRLCNALIDDFTEHQPA